LRTALKREQERREEAQGQQPKPRRR
jgi:hypothetical protein